MNPASSPDRGPVGSQPVTRRGVTLHGNLELIDEDHSFNLVIEINDEIKVVIDELNIA